ncbi:MAG TPA: penicillin-binding transpeptidase domain-containing protein [Streptosporangiaceae bacterium]|nr:penicillin-binding transpeptidase domain-containing protein [Streptosporangiaceae bacterium]
MSHGSARRTRRRSVTALVVVAVVVVAGAGAAAGYLLLRAKGSPAQTAASYLSDWQRGDYSAMNKISVNVPQSGLATPLRQAAAELGMRGIHLKLGQVTGTQARFTATADLASGHTWAYQGRLRLVSRSQRWWVNWSPAAIYPGLRAGERFVLSATWPTRAPVLAADGTALSSPQVIAQSGSLALLTGTVVAATAAQAKALGAPYQAGDLIGQGGVEQAYQAQLAGRPSLTIDVEGPGNHIDSTAARFASSPGKPVRTSIDMPDQTAASAAVSAAATSKPIDLVAIQPSTGKVLAVVERPGGFDRALAGIFPPGSTFKVVTASALAETGLRPSSTVQCPSQVVIGGRTFHNDNNEHLGTTDLQTAFAISCNSTFAMLATQRLSGTALASMAATFGFNANPALGIPATLGHFSTPTQPIDEAADAFGQGTDLVNPLSQASVAAAIEDGTWRPPVLVTSPMPRQSTPPHQLSAAILGTLRPMMRAVVTGGTAAGVGFPPGVFGKTGTAQFGNGTHSHGWFIGYRGDLAFAVLVEGGGTGADSAGPVVNAFLRKLRPRG